jgi:hypothetical protein
VQRSDASRQRLTATVGRLRATDLQLPTDADGWTVAQVLGHLAFWDRFLAARWRAALAIGPAEQPTYLPDELPGLLNEALAPAPVVDGIIAGLPAETPDESILAERPALLDRSIHRLEHLAAIDLALAHGG